MVTNKGSVRVRVRVCQRRSPGGDTGNRPSVEWSSWLVLDLDNSRQEPEAITATTRDETETRGS